MRGSSGSSIIIEGSLLAGGGTGPSGGKLSQADVVLEEVPAQLVIRDNFVQVRTHATLIYYSHSLIRKTPCCCLLIRTSRMQTAADDGRWGPKADYRLVKVVPEVDLDGPYMAFATDDNIRARPTFEISGTNWGGGPTQLHGNYYAGTSAVFDLPSQLQPFQIGGRVEVIAPPTKGAWRAGAVVWNRHVWAAGVDTDKTPAGWICVESGTPGSWQNLSLNP
jgi:hypothetical protein